MANTDPLARYGGASLGMVLVEGHGTGTGGLQEVSLVLLAAVVRPHEVRLCLCPGRNQLSLCCLCASSARRCAREGGIICDSCSSK